MNEIKKKPCFVKDKLIINCKFEIPILFDDT